MIEIFKLIMSMFLEGTSIPFPGIVFLLTWGSVYKPETNQIAFMSIVLALSYSLASFIPYFIGRKAGSKIFTLFGEKINSAVTKGSMLMNKYGLIILCVSRPFGWGNYVSYIAGISRVNKLKYFILTFIGIYPWSFVMLMLGKRFGSNIGFVTKYIDKYTIYIYIVVIIISLVFGISKYIKYRKLKIKE